MVKWLKDSEFLALRQNMTNISELLLLCEVGLECFSIYTRCACIECSWFGEYCLGREVSDLGGFSSVT